MPKEALSVVGEYIGYISTNQSNAMLIAGITMTLFSASAAFRALMNIMDDIYERKSYTGLWQIVASVIFSILFLVTIYLSIVVVLTGTGSSPSSRASSTWTPAHCPGTGSGCASLSSSRWCSLFVLLAHRMAAPWESPGPPSSPAAPPPRPWWRPPISLPPGS